MTRLVLWAVMLSFAGCGGRYIESGSEGAGASNPTSEPPTSASGGSAGGNKGGSYANPTLPKHDLGVCTPGFDHASHPGQACPWLTESGQCFATNDAACSCACPTDHDSFCYTDFDAPDTPSLVHCY